MPIHGEYVRLESDREREFYTPPAGLTENVSSEVGKLLAKLREQLVTFKPLTGWRVEDEELARAADALAATAHEVFGVRLSLDDEDPLHFDAFLNRFVIAPELRTYFDGAMVKKGLSDRDYEKLANEIEGVSIPSDETLYYFLGAYWGEWLVRHRRAKWMIHPPLRTVQAFPDMITTHGTVCLMPFSQVLKKLTDPVGENLAYKSTVFEAEYLPSYPLVASMADSHEATLSLMPQEMRLAEEALKVGDLHGALGLLVNASEREPENLLLLQQIQQVAWQAEEYDTAHKAMTALLRQHAHARTFYNLGAFYAQLELLDEAIESMRQAVVLHPHFGKAKLALAGLLAASGDVEMSKEILRHLLTESYDSAIQEEAQEYLMQLEQDGEV